MRHMVLILAAMAGPAGRPGDDPVLVLHDRGKVVTLDAKAASAVRPSALRLLQSSNFNSEGHREILNATPQSVHAAYRKALAGRYLVVTYELPRIVRTIGGDVDVLEVVVGLDRSDHVDSLFTVDSEGRVASHAKYNGTEAIEVLKKVEEAVPGR